MTDDVDLARAERAESAERVTPTIEIAIRRLDPDLPLPSRAHAHDAGYDLVAAADATIAPGGRAPVPTGIAIAIPPGYGGFVLPRSGLALRHGISLLNTPGLIDSGYRDEVKLLLVNHDTEHEFTVRRGDRVAQLVIQRVEAVDWRVVDALEDSERGLGGFGSSGV